MHLHSETHTFAHFPLHLQHTARTIPPPSPTHTAALEGKPDGSYLVRARAEGAAGEYFLCVVYKGKPTTHQLAADASGTWLINKKIWGSIFAKSMAEVRE